jgi:hypothetical protein
VGSLSTALRRATGTVSARWVALAPVLAALLLGAVLATPLGATHGALALLLAGAVSALATYAVGVVALLALVVLLAAATPRPAFAVVTVGPSRQQDPTTPGRPRPRAPGATPLPCAH